MYYVVNPDGSKFGPASKDMIQQWHREGRIAPDAWFEDGATEVRVPRSDILPDAPTTAPPVGQGQSQSQSSNPYQQTPHGYPQTPQGQAQAQHPQQQYGSSQHPYGQQQYGQPSYGQQQQPYGAPQPHLYGNQYGNQAANVPGKITVAPGGHSTVIAALLAFFTFIGGYLYNKQYVKGVVVTIVAIVVAIFTGGFLGLVVSLAATYDCYKIAERLNRGEAVDQWQFF